MNREETLKILALLKAAYPNSYKNMTAAEANGTVSIWQMQFADIPADVVLIALHKVIAVSVYPPTVADIRGKFREIYIESDLMLRDSAENLTESEKRRLQHITDILYKYFPTNTIRDLPLRDILKSFPTNDAQAIAAGNNKLNGGVK